MSPPANTRKTPAATNGPAPSFKEEMIGLAPQLRAFCRFLCRGDAHAADDLAQEALMRAWAARDSYQPGTNMRAWMFVIARNLHYSAKRRQRFAPTYGHEATENDLKVEAEQESILELNEVSRALAVLPRDQHDALILVSAGGVSYEEAATICGCAVGTIKSRVNRARTALMALLEETRALPKGEAVGEQALETLVEEARRLVDER
ncbi:MAG: sigma-70 family RNA polymerase sigma factor [Alphaproteobacteria bacterium]|nr:sigma-70 family RNA polymerase sigma factor [Alphaproteobacteria bacterium]